MPKGSGSGGKRPTAKFKIMAKLAENIFKTNRVFRIPNFATKPKVRHWIHIVPEPSLPRLVLHPAIGTHASVPCCAFARRMSRC